MKKIAVIFLLLVYGPGAIGATVHLHYCMNDFVGWSLWHGDDDKCGKCGMKEKKDGCCKDEHKQVKLKAEHQKSTDSIYIQLLDAPVLITPVTSSVFKGALIPLSFPISKSPPRISKERLFMFHCVFLI
ncbi:MAG: hypothetical protein SFU87_14735 [Chitinophagaceae bacterium]|nr:hypothetical protein [Chitinophagaceae bacterium]